jgi:hypothetical protein
MPIGATMNSPAQSAAGREDVGDLGGGQGHGQVGFDAGADRFEGVRGQSRGDVDGQPEAPGGVDIRHGAGEQPVQGLEEPGAENGVDDDGGLEDLGPQLVPSGRRADLLDRQAHVQGDPQVRRRVPFDLVLRGQEQDLRAGAAEMKVTGDDEAVPAVVALAGDDDDPQPLRVREELPEGPDDLQAGVLHEHDPRDAQVLDGRPVDLSHLAGGQDLHGISSGSRASSASAARIRGDFTTKRTAWADPHSRLKIVLDNAI